MKNFILANYDRWAYQLHKIRFLNSVICPSVHLSVCSYVYLIIRPFVQLSICSFIHMSIRRLFICPLPVFVWKILFWPESIKCKWKVNLKINWFDTIDVVRSSSYFDTFSNILKTIWYIGYIFNQLDTFLANG